jgi:(S)-ureidoglycine aminohydrolase
MRIVLFFLAFVSTGVSLAAQNKPVASDVYRFGDLKIEKEETHDRRQFLEGSTRDLELLEIHTSTVPVGKASHAPLKHDDFEELIIVKEGKVKVTINNQTKVLGPGSVALAIPGEEHGFENGGDMPATYYVLKYRSKQPINIERGKKAGGSFMIEWNDLVAKEHAKGSRRDFFEKPTSMTDRYEMHVTMLKEGVNSHDPHTHRAEEIVLIIHGDVSMQIGQEHKKASAGDLIFLGSEVLHALTNTGKGSCEYFAFQWQ